MSSPSRVAFLRHPAFIAGIALRFIFFVCGFDDVFGNRKEIVTPITDYKRVTEGLYLFKLGLSPYAGDTFHQAPLFLPFFSLVDGHPLLLQLLFIFTDAVIALALREITLLWKSRNIKNTTDTKQFENLAKPNYPDIVAALYLLNPFSIASCVGRSTIIFNNLAIVLSALYALKGNVILSTFSVAVASYLSIYPSILILPITALFARSATSQNIVNPKNERTTLKASDSSSATLLSTVPLLLFFVASLLGLSYVLLHSWEFLYDTYGFTLLVGDLTPNVGLFWYFFIEVFKHFQDFYLFAYQYHVFLYAVPLYLRLRHHPLFLFWVNIAIIATFKAYPAFGDLAIQLAFIPLIFDEIKGTRYGFIVAIVTVFVVVLAPVFWFMWIYSGTGNANFYYAINLALTLGQVLFITDAISVVLKDDYLAKKATKEKMLSKKEL